MDFDFPIKDKMRIVQELVPGKQITLAHIIANPDDILYRKLGLDPAVEYSKTAIGIVTMSPAETAIIAGDIAIKSSAVELGFVDRLLEISGLVAAITGLDAMVKAADVSLIHSEKRLGGRLVTLIVKGSVSSVKAAIEAGAKAAEPLGKLHGQAVIANPHGEIMKFFDFED